MKRILAAFSSAVLAAGALVLILAPVNAQQTGGGASGFLVSPVRQELTIEQGKSQTVVLTVENATNAAVTVKAVVNDFEPSDDETGQPKILLDENASAAGNSFKTLVGDLPNIELGPKERKDLSVKISVPSDGKAGGYYGAIRFVPADSSVDKNVALTASVGTIFLIRVPGDLTEQLNLVEFTAAKNGSTGRFFVNSGKMSVVTRLENTGNIHVKPYGKVTVTDRSGKVIQEYEFNDIEPRSNVLPNSTRKFVDELKNQNWFGMYTVTANFGYGSGGSLITAKNTFWVIPAWMLVIIGIVVVALIVGGFVLYRKFANRSHKSVRPRR
jgi:Bacterial protein of unknown function (DUF916)